MIRPKVAVPVERLRKRSPRFSWLGRKVPSFVAVQFRTVGFQVTEKLIELIPGLVLVVLSTLTSTLKFDPMGTDGIKLPFVPERTTDKTGGVLSSPKLE